MASVGGTPGHQPAPPSTDDATSSGDVGVAELEAGPNNYQMHSWTQPSPTGATSSATGALPSFSAAGDNKKPLECSPAPWTLVRVSPGELEICACHARLRMTEWVCVPEEEHPRCFECLKPVRIDCFAGWELKLAYLSVKVLIAYRSRLPVVPAGVTATCSDKRRGVFTLRPLASGMLRNGR